MFFWKVPAPNEALVISGSKSKGGAQFRVVTGHGCFVTPIRQVARKLYLDLREAQINEPCVTKQGIQLKVQAVAVFKVGDDESSIANAARRFLDQQSEQTMETLVGRIFAGHLRSIVGGLTVEEIIRERDRLIQETKDSSSTEMEKMGLVVDSLQIQEITDPSEYIKSLAAPHVAAVQSTARQAQAKADQEATVQEQLAAAANAEAVRDSQKRQAIAQAEIDQARQTAGQAGPLAQAQAQREVVEASTELAKLESERKAAELAGTVMRQADANAYQQTKQAEGEKAARIATAEAEAEAIRLKGQAEADAIRLRGQAEADVLRLRASALKDNQAALVQQSLVESLPKVVEAAAGALTGANLTVLNGADGLNETVSGLVGQGLAVLHTLRDGFDRNPVSNGAAGNRTSVERATTATPTGGERSEAD